MRILLTTTLLFASASSSTSAADAPPAREPRECPAVFGSATVVDEVLARRQTSVESIVEDRYGVVVFHHVGRWAAPKTAPLMGLSLVDVDRERAVLTFDVKGNIEGCAPGRYLVPEASALGSDAVVIASLRDGVLVEKARALTYVPIEGRSAPRFRLVWRSPYAIVRDQPTGGAAVSAGGKRPPAAPGVSPTSAVPVPEAKASALKAGTARREKARGGKK